jgi:hypothetical protein
VDLMSQQEQRTGHLGWVGILVGLFVGQHVPDRNQELPGHGHHCFGAPQVLEALLEVLDPVGMVADGLVGSVPPGGLSLGEALRGMPRVSRAGHHRTPQVAPASLGDAPSGMGYPAVMDARA